MHQKIILRKKVRKMNECMNLAIELNVTCRCSQRGMSVIDSNHRSRFFSIDKIYHDDTECKKYIKEVASPDLQVTLSFF